MDMRRLLGSSARAAVRVTALCLLAVSPALTIATAAAGDLPVAAERGLEPRVPAPKSTHPTGRRWQSDTTLHLKFAEGTAVRLRAGRFVTLSDDDLTGLNQALDLAPGWRAHRMVTRAENEVASDRADNEARSGRRLADFNLWYELTVPEGDNVGTVVEALNALDVVESAYPEPLPAKFPSPSFVSDQGYRLAPSEGGIGAQSVSVTPGATGSRVKVIDVEYSWNTGHEDLDATAIAGAVIRNGTPQDPFSDDNHGTAVLGVLVADADAQGVTGVVSNASVGMVNAYNVERGYDLANAIDLARTNMSGGDVLLIEQQIWGPTGEFVPVEWVAAYYDAIALATAQGIIVVEAAGNGSQNLDAAEFGSPFPSGRPDSGAIIVGAGAAPGCGTARSRLPFSTYGARVDVQGWGECVTTTGYGDLQSGTGKNVFYTSQFNGTSSASAIVAAAAAALSSAHEQSTGSDLTSQQARAQLISSGSAQDMSVPGEIGPLPNLPAALNAPTVAATSPADGATGVNRKSNVSATFSEAVTGVSTSTFILRNSETGTAIAGKVKRGTANQWIFDPRSPLAAWTRYTATLTSGTSAVRDASGDPLTEMSWTFTTAGPHGGTP
jgi:subtilisin family serine protease